MECLYDVPDNKRSPHRAVVTWLCRPAFLPLALDNSHGMEEEGVAGLDNNHEVVGEVRRTTVITLRSSGLELKVVLCSAPSVPQPVFTITEKAPNMLNGR